jgi:hypothetical protein
VGGSFRFSLSKEVMDPWVCGTREGGETEQMLPMTVPLSLLCVITLPNYSVFPLDTEFLYQGIWEWMKSRKQSSSHLSHRFPRLGWSLVHSLDSPLHPKCQLPMPCLQCPSLLTPGQPTDKGPIRLLFLPWVACGLSGHMCPRAQGILWAGTFP